MKGNVLKALPEGSMVVICSGAVYRKEIGYVTDEAGACQRESYWRLAFDLDDHRRSPEYQETEQVRRVRGVRPVKLFYLDSGIGVPPSMHAGRT